MNKEQFWEIIDTINQSFPGKDQELRLRQMVESLLRLSLDEIMDWHLILTEYKNAAYRNDLWAASAALGAHCTDDGFIDFRSWLISRGKEVYMNAMQNPDSLATVPLEGEDLNFEQFGYVAHYAYDKKYYALTPPARTPCSMPLITIHWLHRLLRIFTLNCQSGKILTRIGRCGNSLICFLISTKHRSRKTSRVFCRQEISFWVMFTSVVSVCNICFSTLRQILQTSSARIWTPTKLL